MGDIINAFFVKKEIIMMDRSEAVDEIMLTFKSKIEPFSVLQVLNEKGEEIKFKDKQMEETGILGILEAPLPNGVYDVNWRIISKDGHTIKGEFVLFVAVTLCMV